jgi:formylmethanofuran dehydrogenase subunit E
MTTDATFLAAVARAYGSDPATYAAREFERVTCDDCGQDSPGRTAHELRTGELICDTCWWR